jgi:hypothetical protein
MDALASELGPRLEAGGPWRIKKHFELVGADDVGVQNLDVRHRLDTVATE